MYRIESTIVEELKERNFNVEDLLQAYAKKRNKKAVIEYNIDDEVITHAKGQFGIDIEAEILATLQEEVRLYGKGYDVEIVRKKEE